MKTASTLLLCTLATLGVAAAKTSPEGKRPPPASGKEVKAQYAVGETVKIIEGAFASHTGRIEAVDAERGRLKLSVSVFGRVTPVEVNFSQVERVAPSGKARRNSGRGPDQKGTPN